MENILIGKLKKAELTPTQKRIAQFCIDNQLSLSQMTLQQMAAETTSSEVSVLSFVRKLGFSGFSDFKQWVYNKITEQANLENTQHQRGLIDRLENSPSVRNRDSRLEDYIKTAVTTLESTLMQNKELIYKRVVDELLSSANVYIYGARSACGCALRFTIGLQYLLKNVHYVEESMLYQVASNCSEGDAFYLICLSRFFKSDVSLCKMLKARGVKLIVVTNSAVAPFTQYADYLLLVNDESGHFFHSEIGITGMNEYLTLLVADKESEEAKEKWEFSDRYTDEYRF